MKIRHLLHLLLVPTLLAGLWSSIEAAEPSSGPQDADLFKGKSVNMHFYQNKYFGFDMAIPGDWYVLLKTELLPFIHDPYLKRVIKAGQCFPLLGISKHRPGTPGPKEDPNSNLTLWAEDLSMAPPPGIKTTKDYAEALARAGMKFRSSPSVMKQGTVDFPLPVRFI